MNVKRLDKWPSAQRQPLNAGAKPSRVVELVQVTPQELADLLRASRDNACREFFEVRPL